MDHELSEYINSFDFDLEQFSQVIGAIDDASAKIAACIRKWSWTTTCLETRSRANQAECPKAHSIPTEDAVG